MFTRQQVEQILKINGVEPSAPDDQIKSVLLGARWNESDAASAVVVLRENKNTHETTTDTIHKMFRSDSHLTPESISKLLGIELDLSSADINERRRLAGKSISYGQMVSIAISAAILALAIIFGLLWYFNASFFFLEVF